MIKKGNSAHCQQITSLSQKCKQNCKLKNIPTMTFICFYLYKCFIFLIYGCHILSTQLKQILIQVKTVKTVINYVDPQQDFTCSLFNLS